MPAAPAEGQITILVGSELELAALVGMFEPARNDGRAEAHAAVEAA